MAHVFYADKNPATFEDRSEDKWANQMGYVFAFMEFWNRYKIFRFFNWIPIRIANGIGGVAGKFFLSYSKAYKKKLKRSYIALFPHKTDKKSINRFQKAYSAYLGKLTFSFMGGLTLKKAPPDTSFAQYENLELIDRELEKGKGVLVSITHLGELTQAIWALVNHKKKYTVATIVYVPHMGIYKYANHPYYDNVYFYASTTFRQISVKLENHLKRNHIVMVYYDFGHPGQFRVPFWQNKYPYMLYTPQSIFKLHRRTGASILPCINLPDQVIGKTKMKFLENSRIMAVSENNWNKSDNEFHGRLSMELNSVYAPYLRSFAHVWEQFLDFNKRISNKLQIPSNLTREECIHFIFNKLIDIISHSYEPNRNDKKILSLLSDYSQLCIDALIIPMEIFRSQKSYISLTGLTSVQEIQKILIIISSEMNKFDEITLKNILITLKNSL